MPKWLKNARFYEIYPQSFYDSDGDGIGDLKGITAKLDYIKHIGFNALWLNPCFTSPFMDAGYDVEDYCNIASRYGSLDDLSELLAKAHSMNMRVILDLVPGHTSDRCEWFQKSRLTERNEYSDRYIWTNSVWNRPSEYSWVAGNADRDGCYMLNFFNSQPALNYGFDKITHPEWQIHYTDERVRPTFDAILSVMRFWLDRGADGFRVDMADSLVKNDEDKSATSSLWAKARLMLDKDYPQAALVSEWSYPERSINLAGFHMDFMLSHRGNLTHRAFRDIESGVNNSYFCSQARGNADFLLDGYVKSLAATKERGYISLISGNHDTERISNFLNENEMKIAYCFLLTMPGVPFMYYGDEIGMRFLRLNSMEGGFSRTGSRTPMQWNSRKTNLGFSTADKQKLYLPVDTSESAPCAEDELAKTSSLVNVVRTLCMLRDRTESLQADADFKVLYKGENGYPLCYLRGADTLVALNVQNKENEIPLEVSEKIFSVGKVEAKYKKIVMSPVSAAVFKINVF